jgi:hypothetical protein
VSQQGIVSQHGYRNSITEWLQKQYHSRAPGTVWKQDYRKCVSRSVTAHAQCHSRAAGTVSHSQEGYRNSVTTVLQDSATARRKVCMKANYSITIEPNGRWNNKVNKVPKNNASYDRAPERLLQQDWTQTYCIKDQRLKEQLHHDAKETPSLW